MPALGAWHLASGIAPQPKSPGAGKPANVYNTSTPAWQASGYDMLTAR